MGAIDKEAYKSMALLSFIDQLHDDCYHSLSQQCINGRIQVEKVGKLESGEFTSQYLALCAAVIDEIEANIDSRKEKFIPYIKTLAHKSSTNHDCSNCAGGCKINHDMQLVELRASHQQIKDILNRLQMVALPLYTDTIFPDAYRVLRNMMALVENNLAEIFFLEENYLIPKIIDAQKSINVRIS